MNFTNFAAFVRKQTETDSTSFPNATLTLLANVAKDAIAEDIVLLDGEYFTLELLTDLVADQREYAFPNDLLKDIKLVEAKLDGTNWKRLREFDLNSYTVTQSERTKPYNVSDADPSYSNATTDETTIEERFSDDTPRFDNDGNTITIYSESEIEAVTEGLKLRAKIYPKSYEDSDWTSTDDMSLRSTSTSTSLPRPSHEVLARKVIILFKESNSIPLNAFDLNYEVEVGKMKSKLRSPNLDKSIQPRVPRDTGYNY